MKIPFDLSMLFSSKIRALTADRHRLEGQLSTQRSGFDLERNVLMEEIARKKHMLGVYQKLFLNLDMFHDTFDLVHKSLNLMVERMSMRGRYAMAAYIEMVKVDHLVFKLNVYRLFLMIDTEGDCHEDMGSVIKYTECTFGRWYYGEDHRVLQCYPEFVALDEPHRKIHMYAAQAIACFKSAEYLQGVDNVTKMENASIEVIRLLDNLARHIMDDAAKELENGNVNQCTACAEALGSANPSISDAGDTQ